MNTTDEIILNLIEYLRFDGKIKNERDFAEKIGMLQPTITKIKRGTAHFTVEQMGSICKTFNVNANFLLGLSVKVFNSENSIEIHAYYNGSDTIIKGFNPDALSSMQQIK